MKHSLFTLITALTLATAVRAGLTSGGTYILQPIENPSMALFVENASMAVSARVLLWPQTAVPAQQWTLTALGGNGYTLRNVYTGKYLATSGTARGATAVQVASVTGGRWHLDAADEEQDIYYLRPASSTAYLTATASDGGSAPTLAALSGGGTAQMWRLVAVEPESSFDASLREEVMDRFIAAFVKRHGSYRSFGTGGWGNAEMLEVGLDAYEATGLQKYLTLCRSDYSWFAQNVGANWNHLVYTSDYNWFGHDFNDDVMWQVIAVARMAWLTGESQYLTAAKRNFDLIYKRAFMPQWGMMRWAEESGDDNGTNSCIMGPTEVAACYLAMAGAGEEYFEKARALYAKQRQHLANMQTGQVYDSFVWDASTGAVARDASGKERRNNWASTYNQGTMLGAAVLLYDHYGTEQYAADADRIMDFTVRQLCDADGIIKVCQVNDGDLCGFKGILMRYVRRYVLDLNRPKYQDWLTKNAFRAYNNRDERGLTTSAWLTKSTADVTTNAFSCSCAASAAVNTVLLPVQTDAMQQRRAADFAYQGGVYVTERGNGDRVISLKDGTWVAYDNLHFGDTPARSISIDVGDYPYAVKATVTVHLDRHDAAPIATLTLDDADAGTTVVADIAPTVGTHHVILRFGYANATRTNAFQLTSLRFSTKTAQEIADGVSDIPAGATTDAKCYDLSGRRLSRMPQGGLVICGGHIHSLR